MAVSALHLSHLSVENFRIFGSGENAFELDFGPGLTMFVGPNDSGKSAVLDAIRLVLGTTSRDLNRIVEDDFNYGAKGQASTLRIKCQFDFFDAKEAAPFFEHITPGTTAPTLFLVLTATRQANQPKRTVISDLRSGPDGNGPRPDGTMRALMAATYLRALRDALDELTAGRGSRLSQILHAHPQYASESVPDFKPEDIAADGTVTMPKTLVGTMRLAEHGIEANSAVRSTRDQLNSVYLERLSIVGEAIRGDVGITRVAELRDVLEKLDLWIVSAGGKSTRLQPGLGTNNILYMASEMLLVGGSGPDGPPLLLIEEPEAHLHPQMQLLVGDFLREQSASASDRRNQEKLPPLQILATTHSPTLASQVDLEQIVVMIDGKPFPLRKECTALAADDYRFLSHFLDATRANLFFARGVLIVEGDAENLLLPTLAKILGTPLNKHGVSIVNVGSIGLFRYSRIFLNAAGETRIPVRVACITDLDLPHDSDPLEKRKRITSRRKNQGGSVRTFIPEYETLEYVLASQSFAKEMHLAITLATKIKNSGQPVKEADLPTFKSDAQKAFDELVKAVGGDAHLLASAIYKPLANGNASKAETAQQFSSLLIDAQEAGELSAADAHAKLPQYLVDAIAYATWQKDVPLDTFTSISEEDNSN